MFLQHLLLPLDIDPSHPDGVGEDGVEDVLEVDGGDIDFGDY